MKTWNGTRPTRLQQLLRPALDLESIRGYR
ncbi:hypothetical protein LINGRAHAP2_LOCUS22442, partial [Linum grandiflorum]